MAVPPMSSRISVWLEKLLEPRIVALTAVVLASVIAGGFAYVLAHRPPPMAGTRIVWPSLNVETSSEMIVVAFLYLLGFAGLWMMYEAAKYKHRGEYVTQYLLGGLTVLVLSFLMLVIMASAMK